MELAMCGGVRPIVLSLVLTAGLLPGCALDRSSFTYDNQSRLPWFNFSLMPAAKEEGPKYQRSISLRTEAGTPRPAVRLAIRDETTVVRPLPVLPLPRFAHDDDASVTTEPTTIEF
jgi:hypothetical protein